MKRKHWAQFEVIRIAQSIGLKNFDRRFILYWTRKGIFPKAVVGINGVFSLYDNDEIDKALLTIAKRSNNYVKKEGLKKAKEEVLRTPASTKLQEVINLLKKEG